MDERDEEDMREELSVSLPSCRFSDLSLSLSIFFLIIFNVLDEREIVFFFFFFLIAV